MPSGQAVQAVLQTGFHLSKMAAEKANRRSSHPTAAASWDADAGRRTGLPAVRPSPRQHGQHAAFVSNWRTIRICPAPTAESLALIPSTGRARAPAVNWQRLRIRSA